MHNPYQAPESLSHTSAPPQRGRPFSVWLLLLLTGFLAISFGVGGARNAWFLISDATRGDLNEALFGLAWRAAVFIAMVCTMVGVFRRRQWGRWLGIGAIAIWIVLIILLPDGTNYASPEERAGGTLGRLMLFPALFVWFGYKFGFSAKSVQYFKQ